MKINAALIVFSLFFYVILSWVLLFRQEQTLVIFGQLYPQLGSFLLSFRNTLLPLGLNSIISVVLLFTLSLSFVGYLRLLKEKISVKAALILAIGLQFLVFFSYPVLSTDIFDYILTNRVATVYHANIWQTPPNSFPNDPFYRLASWQTQTSPYGAVNQFFYSLAGNFSGEDLVGNVIVYKLLVVFFVCASIIVLKTIMARHFPGKVGWGILVVFANPLFVIETAGSAHNIIITLFFMLLVTLFFLEKKFFWTGTAAALAVHTKFVPLFMAVFLCLNLLANQKIKNLLYFVVPFMLLNVLLFAVIGTGTINYLLSILVAKPIYWQSLAQLFSRFFSQGNLALFVVFCVVFVTQAIRGLRNNSNPLALFVETVTAYLLFFTSFYLNWYVLWVVIFVPFLLWGNLSRTVLVFSGTSLLAYPFYMLSLRIDHQNPIWLVLIYLLISGVPAVYYLLGHGKILAKTSA